MPIPYVLLLLSGLVCVGGCMTAVTLKSLSLLERFNMIGDSLGVAIGIAALALLLVFIDGLRA